MAGKSNVSLGYSRHLFNRTRRASLLAGLIALCGSPAFAGAPPEPPAGGRIPLLQGATIVIDGVADETAWQDALVQEIPYEIEPGDNSPAPVRTTARLGYTHDALYLAFHAQDPDPAAILAHLRDRDSVFNDDWVGVFLDTFDDNRRGYEFVINPLGVQGDLIRDETSVQNREDSSWDGLWISAGRLTAEGYEVEVRIPFSTLRFPGGMQDQRWGISLLRTWPRGKRYQMTSHPVPRDSNCFECEWGSYHGMAGARQGSNLEIVPTLTMGQQQTREAAADPWGKGDTSIEPGLDLGWSPSPKMTVNATLNPDFSQVETDQLQLDTSSSFALFYQEKRPFFLEGADYFTTPFDVLYTRQIADPDAGLRLTGRTTSGSYGAIAARDASTVVLVPGVLGSGFEQLDQVANVAVGRYRHNIGEYSSIGVIGTAREGHDYQNLVAGLDARWQRRSHILTAQLLHSDSQYPAQIVDVYRDDLGEDATPAGLAWQAAYEFSNRHWNIEASHVAIDRGFRADLGFMGQVGYEKSLAGLGRTWYRDGAAINRIELSGDFDTTHRYDGQLLEREWEASLEFVGPRRSFFALHGLTRKRFWEGRLFDERYADINGEFRALPQLLLGAYLSVGTMLDLDAARTGRREVLETWADADIGRGVSLEWNIQHQRMHRDGGMAFRITVVNAGGSWQFDPRQRLRISLQGSQVLRNQALYTEPVNRKARDVAMQLVYSYKINPRTALYAGGNWGAFRDDDNPHLFGNTRSVFVKLGYGWQPRR